MVTGVQIHNWGAEFDDSSPNLEFVAPCSVYVVVRGERTNLDLQSIPVSPRHPTPTPARMCSQPRTQPKICSRFESGIVVCDHNFSLEELCSSRPFLAHAALVVLLQPMTPRQIAMLTSAGSSGASRVEGPEHNVCGSAGGVTTLRAIDAPYSYNSR